MAKFGDGGELLKCSFCGKSQSVVRKLIAGPGVYICNECVDLTVEIISEELGEEQFEMRPAPRLDGERPAAGPRIAPFAGERSEPVAEIIESSTAMGNGEPLNIFLTMAHHGRVLESVVALGTAFFADSVLPERLREVVVLRVARDTRSVYEYAQHRVIAQQADLTIDEIESLVATGSELVGHWNTAEQAVIAMVDQLCANDNVNDATWTALAEQHSESELVELLMLVGYYRMIAGFLNASRVALDDGLEDWPRPPVPVSISIASNAEIDAIHALDRTVVPQAEQSVRPGSITAAVLEFRCLVARRAHEIIGFAIWGNSFFEFPSIELVVVHPDHRRRGLATALMQRVETEVFSNPLRGSSDPIKLFTSTNESNTAMQAFCEKVGFVRSGIVENLDDGDPEIIYFKLLADPNSFSK